MKQRALTALALALPILALLAYKSSYIILALCALCVTLAVSEWCTLMKLESALSKVYGTLFALAPLGYSFSDLSTRDKIVLTPAFLALSVAGILSFKDKQWARFFFGLVWIGVPFAALAMIAKLMPGPDAYTLARPLFLLLVPQWFGDTAAIYAGKAFKGPLLAPTLSPKKTWSGAIGNLVACIASAGLIASALHFPVALGLGIGVAQGILGQAGDLFESKLKRDSQVKDSGNLLPGHGGILDRVDSMLFSAPVCAALLATFGG